jgi:hypothetical protein
LRTQFACQDEPSDAPANYHNVGFGTVGIYWVALKITEHL